MTKIRIYLYTLKLLIFFNFWKPELVSTDNLPFPTLASLNGTWNAVIMLSCSWYLRLQLCLWLPVCFLETVQCFYLEVPEQASPWLTQSFILLLYAVAVEESSWRSLVCWDKDLTVLEYPLTWDKKKIRKVQQVVQGSSVGQLTDWGYQHCMEKDLRSISNIICLHCNVYGGVWAEPLSGHSDSCKTAPQDVVVVWPAYKWNSKAEQLQRSHHNCCPMVTALSESHLNLLSLTFSRA